MHMMCDHDRPRPALPMSLGPAPLMLVLVLVPRQLLPTQQQLQAAEATTGAATYGVLSRPHPTVSTPTHSTHLFKQLDHSLSRLCPNSKPVLYPVDVPLDSLLFRQDWCFSAKDLC